MDLGYDAEHDTLEIWLELQAAPEASFHHGDLTVVLGDEGQLLAIVIRQARAFIARCADQGLSAASQTAKRFDKSSSAHLDITSGGKVWHDADSSMISAYTYDQENQILEVAFNRSGVYCYFAVPLKVFQGLHRASSKGSYMRSMTIDQYAWQKKR